MRINNPIIGPNDNLFFKLCPDCFILLSYSPGGLLQSFAISLFADSESRSKDLKIKMNEREFLPLGSKHKCLYSERSIKKWRQGRQCRPKKSRSTKVAEFQFSLTSHRLNLRLITKVCKKQILNNCFEFDN